MILAGSACFLSSYESAEDGMNQSRIGFFKRGDGYFIIRRKLITEGIIAQDAILSNISLLKFVSDYGMCV